MKNNKFRRRIQQKPSQRAPLQPTRIDRRIKRRNSQPNRLLPIIVGIGGLCILMFAFCSIIGNNKESKILQGNETLQVEEELNHNDEETENASLDLYYYHSMIAGDERELYDLILDGMLVHDTSIILPAGIENKLPEMTQMILNDHPEIFWVDGAYQYTAYDDKTDLEINYVYSRDEIKSRTKEIEATVNEFNLLLSPEDTDYDIVCKAYLYLIDTVEYVSGSSDNQNIYSSLVNRKSVCAGYSKATQYLLQRNGIQTLYVSSGLTNGSYGWDNHAWNIVRCDGEYYQVDTTFGDGYTNPDVRMAELGIHNYAYLCIDDDTMYRNHQPSKELTIPKCNSLKLNYYLQNGLYADAFDEQVMQSMRDFVFKGEKTWCYQFSNYEAYSECLKSIQESTYSMIVSEYLVDACQTTYIHDDEMYYVMCWY